MDNPNETPAGGGTPVPAAEQVAAPAKVEVKVAPEAKPEPKPDPEPKAITLTPEQYERFRTAERERDALRKAEDARAEEARKAEDARLLEEGKLKELIANKDKDLAARDTKIRDAETRFRNTTLERDLASEVARHPWLEGTTDQIMKLMRDEFVVVEDGDTFRTQTRDGKSVSAFVAEAHGSKKFAHFVPSGTRGGSDSRGTDQTRRVEVTAATPFDIAIVEAMKARRDPNHPATRAAGIVNNPYNPTVRTSNN